MGLVDWLGVQITAAGLKSLIESFCPNKDLGHYPQQPGRPKIMMMIYNALTTTVHDRTMSYEKETISYVILCGRSFFNLSLTSDRSSALLGNLPKPNYNECSSGMPGLPSCAIETMKIPNKGKE
ncbi:hypothetical protein PoB_001934400 [Plakobranchus ocellatus]|uniref:Uncharacterized protein n=1 Tax=Plakobranchus ocellatus TaxID=259542 RepID=A0AAV3ZEN3_9GAST|nr:hypothetical protein PoB_001934400 [Plakobranchus ocellatus]